MIDERIKGRERKRRGKERERETYGEKSVKKREIDKKGKHERTGKRVT